MTPLLTIVSYVTSCSAKGVRGGHETEQAIYSKRPSDWVRKIVRFRTRKFEGLSVPESVSEFKIYRT